MEKGGGGISLARWVARYGWESPRTSRPAPPCSLSLSLSLPHVAPPRD
jgi:hypothetical protein